MQKKLTEFGDIPPYKKRVIPPLIKRKGIYLFYVLIVMNRLVGKSLSALCSTSL